MIRRRPVIALLLAAFVSTAGCGPTRPSASRVEQPGGAVAHVVVFWLKRPGDEDGRRRVVEASHAFRSIPGVLSVEAGGMLPSPRPNVDKSYDVAVVMWFKDRAALERYQVDPRHKEMLREVGPLVERTVAYDFVAGSLGE